MEFLFDVLRGADRVVPQGRCAGPSSSVGLFARLLRHRQPALSGFLVLQRTNELRSELTESFASVDTSNDVAALRHSGTYLSNRLFNALKIDRSFVHGLCRDDEDAQITATHAGHGARSWY
jgi:hypothetical protein